MKKLLKTAFCFQFLLTGIVFGQDKVADSLKQALANTQTDTTKIILLGKLAEMLPNGEWEVYNDKMEVFALERLKNARGKERKIYLNSLASAYNNKSLQYKNKGEISRAIEYGEKSLAIFKQLKDQKNICVTSFNNGQLYFSLGDVTKSILSVEYALKLSRTYHPGMVTYCLNYLGFINKEQEEYDKSLEYHEEAYKIALASGDQESIAYTLSLEGMLFTDQEKYVQALDAFGQSLNSYIQMRNDQNVAAQYDNIGYVYEKEGQYAEAYKNYIRSLRINDSLGIKMALSATLNSIGRNYLLWGKEAEAQKNFERSLELGKQLGFPRHIFPPAMGLYKIYKKKGDIARALSMYELAIQMHDSINNEDTRANTLRSQYRYEYEKKATTDSIKALEAEKIRSLRIEKERTRARAQRYLFIGGIIALLLIGFFVFQRFRLRQKVKELKIRNKIASDLHDEVGSALSSISLLSGMAKTSAVPHQQTMQKIEETSRETVENMSDIVWSIQPKNDKLTDVVKRMKHYGQQLFTSLGTGFEFTAQEETAQIPLDMEYRKNLYLIYKEALNNAAKYAKAGKITVSIGSQSKKITLRIADDGVGFDMSNDRMGNGLFTMQERARKLGGTLTVNSAPQQGTTVLLEFKTG